MDPIRRLNLLPEKISVGLQRELRVDGQVKIRQGIQYAVRIEKFYTRGEKLGQTFKATNAKNKRTHNQKKILLEQTNERKYR